MGDGMTWEAVDGNLPGKIARNVPLRERIAAVLAPFPTKVIARVADAAPRTVEAWKQAENAPSAEALLRLAAEFDEVWAIVRQQSCRDVTDAERILDQMAEMMKRRGG